MTTAVCFLVFFTAAGTYRFGDHLGGDRGVRGVVQNELDEEEVLNGNEETREEGVAEDHVEDEGSEKLVMNGDFGGVEVANTFGDFSSMGSGGVNGESR